MWKEEAFAAGLKARREKGLEMVAHAVCRRLSPRLRGWLRGVSLRATSPVAVAVLGWRCAMWRGGCVERVRKGAR